MRAVLLQLLAAILARVWAAPASSTQSQSESLHPSSSSASVSPSASTSQPYRIVFGSCNSARKLGLWTNIHEQSKPDELILLGDNMYADSLGWDRNFIPADEAALRHQYALLSNDPGFQQVVADAGGSISATFDDHDYGINNGDKTYPLRNLSQHLFNDFLGIPLDSPRRQQSGVYSSKLVEGVPLGKEATLSYKVIMLDSRSNKDTPGTLRGDFLGEEQWAWLERELADARPDVIFLGSSIQVLPDDKVLEETWSDFPQARARLVQMIANAAAPNIFILSGDVHTGEVLQSKCRFKNESDYPFYEQFRLYEFTSSGLTHTFTKTTPFAVESAQKGSDPALFSPMSTFYQRSRGIFHEMVYDMFVSTSVTNSREFKFRDHYRGLHYGLVELKSSDSVVISILDYIGTVVLQRKLPLRTREEKNVLGGGRVECRPFHGTAPGWRISLAFHSLWLIPLLYLGMPATILILLCFVLGFAKKSKTKTP